MGVRATLGLLGVVVEAACGGQSLDPGAESGGSAGTTGGSGAAGSPHAGGASGSTGSGGSGQAARGGSGGSGAGGSGVGGSVIAGGAVGMAGAGGAGATSAGRGGAGTAGSGGSVGTSGSGPSAGSGGVPGAACSLPIEVGPCDAAILRYAFNPKTSRCEPFTYGGCSGNANNFETFEACLAACGPADESDCPVAQPMNGAACTGPAHPCDYSGSTACLCHPTGLYTCAPVTSETTCFSVNARTLPAGGAGGECTGPDCPQAVVVISYFTCACDAGQWSCSSGGR